MENQIIKCLLLKNGDLLISEIAEVDTELGGPDCKLINPYKMKNDLFGVKPKTKITPFFVKKSAT